MPEDFAENVRRGRAEEEAFWRAMEDPEFRRRICENVLKHNALFNKLSKQCEGEVVKDA